MDEESISIYFGLEQGSRADIEVIARSLLELSFAIKDVTYYLDPGLEIKIEVVRGADGSLIVDLIIKAVKYVTPDKETLRGLPLIILFWLGTDLRQYIDNKWLDHVLTKDGTSEADITHQKETEKKAIQAKLDDINHDDVGGIHIRNFYGNLYLDHNITSVGATQSPGKRPETIVRRQDFPAKAHLDRHHRVTEVRVLKEEMRVTLISPMLVAGHRKWKFKGQNGEFSAPINDNDFQRKFLAGQTSIKLQAGIDMDVVVSVLENRIDGVWHVASREIVEVKGFRPAQHQGSLDFGN